MEREYFDAKFEGIEKLMTAHKENTDDHINAVSSNVKAVAKDLSEHKEKTDAHGTGEGRRVLDTVVKWGSLAIAALALVLGIKKGHP